MRKLGTRLTIATFIATLAGCATSSQIVPIGKDTYMLNREAATGFAGTANVKIQAISEAGQYCQKEGKQLRVVGTHEIPGGVGRFSAAEVQFMCLNASDADFNRSPLKPLPTAVIEVKHE